MCPITHHVASVPAIASSSCAFISTFICTFTCTFSISNWLSLAWWIVALLISHNNYTIKSVGESAAHAGTLPGIPAGFRRAPRGQGLSPVRAAGKVVKGSLRGVLTTKKRMLTTRSPTTPPSLPIRIGGFQDQACLALFVWLSSSSGLWRLWFLLKGDLGQPLFLPRPSPDPGIFQFR
jgi:hypothetical protein